MVDIKCISCGNIFSVDPYRKDQAKFCSRKCRGVFMTGKPTWNKGKKTGIVPKNSFKKGSTPWNKGLHVNLNPEGGFKKGMTPWNKGLKGYNSGDKHPQWNGGRYIRKGYLCLKINGKYILEHRLIAEKCLNRRLTKNEVVHHINEDITDNRPENLYLFSSLSEHRKFHALKDKPILKTNLLQRKY